MKNIKIYVGVLVIILVLLGVFFAASVAGPSNPLYPVRLNVVEKIKAVSKTGEINKAHYALDLGTIRLKELQMLKENNALETKAGNLARDNFNQQTVLAQKITISLYNQENIEEREILQLSEILDVQIEEAKAIFNIDQLEVLDEDVPVLKATSTKK